MSPTANLCIDCRYFRPFTQHAFLGLCERQWFDPITGSPLQKHLSAVSARRDLCQSACGWEAKEAVKS